jgi:hypothetical protein
MGCIRGVYYELCILESSMHSTHVLYSLVCVYYA